MFMWLVLVIVLMVWVLPGGGGAKVSECIDDLGTPCCWCG